MASFSQDPVALRLFADAGEGIAVFNERDELVAWNPAARAMTGWDDTDAASRDLLAHAPGTMEIGDGRWVDLRRGSVAGTTGRLTIVFLGGSALVDPVTKLAGPEFAMAHLERSVALAKRDARATGVICVGIDLPKIAEDVSIDELLGQLGTRVIAATRSSDLAARVGASQLLIVLTAMAHANDAAVVGVRLLLQLSRQYTVAGRERSATVSLGVASYPTDGDTAGEVLRSARGAMERARAAGGGYRVAESGQRM